MANQIVLRRQFENPASSRSVCVTACGGFRFLEMYLTSTCSGRFRGLLGVTEGSARRGTDDDEQNYLVGSDPGSDPALAGGRALVTIIHLVAAPAWTYVYMGATIVGSLVAVVAGKQRASACRYEPRQRELESLRTQLIDPQR